MPLNSQQVESPVRSHAGGKIIVWENCWELCRKNKKVPQTIFYVAGVRGGIPFKRNEDWNWFFFFFFLQIELCLNCRGAQAQSACSDFSLRPPLIWALVSCRCPAGLTEQPCQLGLSKAQIFSVINGSFQWPSSWQEGTAKWKLPRWSFLIWACVSEETGRIVQIKAWRH